MSSRACADDALNAAVNDESGDRALVTRIERELVEWLETREGAREATCATATNARRRKFARRLATHHGVETKSIGEGKDERVVWVKPDGWTMDAMGERIGERESEPSSSSAAAAKPQTKKVIRVKSKATNTSPPGDIDALSREVDAMRMKATKEASTQTTEQREEAYRVARQRIFGVEGDGNDNLMDDSRSLTPRAQSPRLDEAQSSGSDGVIGFERNRGKALKKNSVADSFDPDFRPRGQRGAGRGVSSSSSAAPPLPPGQPPVLFHPGMHMPLPPHAPHMVPMPPHFGARMPYAPAPVMMPPRFVAPPTMPQPIPSAQFAPSPHVNPHWVPQPHTMQPQPMYPPHQGGDRTYPPPR